MNKNTAAKWEAPKVQEIGRRAIQDMRDWLSDCAWPDASYEDIQDMDAVVIARATSRHFDGGVCAFVETI